MNLSPRRAKRGVDLISDALPFGRLWYGELSAISNAVGYAEHYSRSHDAVISVFDDAWQRDRDARAEGRFQRVVKFFNRAAPEEKYELMCPMLREI